jgi:preprotein translocase subunit SecD
MGCNKDEFAGFTNIKPVQVKLYALYDSDKINLESPYIRRIFYDPYVLNINITNVFSMTHQDIGGLQIRTNGPTCQISFHLKKSLYPEFYRFTANNTNTYVAVMVDGKVKTIAKIDKPIPDGNFRLVAKQSQYEQVRKFISLFVL